MQTSDLLVIENFTFPHISMLSAVLETPSSMYGLEITEICNHMPPFQSRPNRSVTQTLTGQGDS